MPIGGLSSDPCEKLTALRPSPQAQDEVQEKIMAFLFQKPSQTTSPHSQRRDHHHFDNMATASLKIRTPEEAGMLMLLQNNTPRSPSYVLLNED
jgi:hypothetical protein